VTRPRYVRRRLLSWLTPSPYRYLYIRPRYDVIPLKSAKHYQAQGVASWYGRKFHGHQTSNGEIYDMFAMSAAHKTLPIPSFVRVTNTGNNKSIIVKVNDRGPFHDNRLIDVSYAAAYALDMLKIGTANVSLEVITGEQKSITAELKTIPAKPKAQPVTAKPDNYAVTTTVMPPPAGTANQHKVEPLTQAHEHSATTVTAPKTVSRPTATITDPAIFVQVVSSSDKAKISQAGEALAILLQHPTLILSVKGIHKLRFGPLSDKQQAQTLINTLKNNGYHGAYMLYSQPSLPHN
jgi:rare lipoprotein A